MSILTDTQILDLLKKPANADMLKRAQALLSQHQLHVKGDGLLDFLVMVDTLENRVQVDLRRKFAKAFTVPIMAPELNTFHNIFSAQGGSAYYDFGSSDKLKSDFSAFISTDVGDGMSMREWMEEVWLDKVNYDSTGLMMVELPEQITPGNVKPYLTWRSVMDIHDIGFTGKKIEYVIFCKTVVTPDATYREFRVVDDARDLLVTNKDADYVILQDSILPNFWKRVPARFMSNMVDSRSKARTSYIWQAIGVLEEMLMDASIHSISKKLHGFPLKWMRKRVCGTCKGNQQVINPLVKQLQADGKAIGMDIATMIPCGTCNGTGEAIKIDVSDVIMVPTLNSKEDADNIPVAGYVTPDLATLKEQRDEMMWLAYIVHKGIWAEENAQSLNTDTAGPGKKTATEDNNDLAAIYTKLNKVSKNAEQMEHFLIDLLAQARYGDAYKFSVINYGRRYCMGSVDEAEETYTAAKASGMASHLLDAYLDDLIYIKFANDPVERDRQLMLSCIEPFIHLTALEVQTLAVPMEDYLMKIYFNDYIERFEREVKSISLATADEVLAQIKIYNAEKLAQQKAETPAPLPAGGPVPPVPVPL